MNSPFKFLDAYTKQDKDIFFGRERETEDLFQKVFESKILLVYGISGTGKTSIINCGLANKFEDSDWMPVYVRRGKDMNTSLDIELEKASLTELDSSSSLTKRIKSLYLDFFKPVYLIFDQFEELFIFGNDEERKILVENIHELVDSNVECRCIFSLREEYLAHLSEFESLIPEFLSNRQRIEKMTRQQARDVIEGPCLANGIELEQDFPDTLLEKLSPGSTKVELTYLQVFLDMIFRLSAGQNRFTIDQIEKAGEVSDLLGNFLEEQINTLDDPETGLLVLKAFVSMQGTKKLISLDEIGVFAQTFGSSVDPQVLTELLLHFVNLRVLKDKDENDLYELRHDSLASKIYEKITLVEKELLEIKDFLENAYMNNQRRGVLLLENDLTYIAPYLDKLFLSKEIMQLISTSKKAAARKITRRRRLIAVGAIALIVVLTVFSGWAIKERQEAVKQSEIARDQEFEAIIARNDALDAEYDAENAKDEALRQKALADSALVIAEKQRNVAEYQRKISIQQRDLAEQMAVAAEVAREEAVSMQAVAEEERIKAEETSRKALHQLYLFNAQEFAAQSIAIKSSDTLKALFALTALELYEYGNEIYADTGDIQMSKRKIDQALREAIFHLQPNTLAEGEVWDVEWNEKLIMFSNDLGKIQIAEIDSTAHAGSRIRIIKEIDVPGDPVITKIVSLDREDKIAFGTSDGQVVVLESIYETNMPIRKMHEHNMSIESMIYIPEKDLLIASSIDRLVSIVSFQNWTYDSHYMNSRVNSIAQIDEKRILISTESEIYSWDLDEVENGPELILSGYSGIKAIAWDKLNQIVVVAMPNALDFILLDDNNGILEKKGAIVYEMPNMLGHWSAIEISNDYQWLATAITNGTIYLWELSALSKALSKSFGDRRLDEVFYPISVANNAKKIFCLKFDPDSKHLLYGSNYFISLAMVSREDIIGELEEICIDYGKGKQVWLHFKKGEITLPRFEK